MATPTVAGQALAGLVATARALAKWANVIFLYLCNKKTFRK
jgi:hypothetical protein